MAEDAKDENKVVEEVLPNPEANPRNQRMMEIAAEENQHKKDGEELVDVADGDHDKTATIQEEPEPEPAAAPAKFKLKVNGVDMEFTEAEMIERAQKAEAAEQKFQEAARLKREADETLARAQPPVKADAAPTVDDDDRARARALQMGSEEEAANVIRQMRTSQAPQPGQIAGMVELINAGNWFRQEYADVFSDPRLAKLALDEDERMVKAGDRRSYRDRYKAIGDDLRTWKGTQAKQTEQKIENKRDLQLGPKADVRAAQKGDAEESDGPNDRDFIAQEAKRRGQQAPH